MSGAEDHCDLCDLPRSQCVHGIPPPPQPPAAPSVRRTPRPRTPPRAAAPTPPAHASRPVARRWTPPEAFESHVLAVLRDAGGELDADELFLELEIRLEDRLTAGDRERTPEGEPRWQYAARRARQALIAQGLMAGGRPGVWVLTGTGRRSS